MDNSKRIFKNIIFLAISEIASKGMIFLTNAYLARVIRSEGFGLFSVATAFTSYFSIIINLGFNTVGTRLIAQNNNEINRVVDAIVTIRALLGIITIIIFLTTLSLISFSGQEKVMIMISAVNLLTLIFTLDWVFQGLERMDVIGIRQIVTSFLNLAGYYIFVKTKDDLYNSMIVLVSTTLINSVWMLWYFWKKHGQIRLNFDWKFWKELFKASLPITLSIVFLTVLSNINILMLKALYHNGNHAAGIFNAAYKVIVLSIIPATIVQGAFFPLLARSKDSLTRNNIVNDYLRINSIIGMIFISIGILFSDSIINIIFGNGFYESGYVLKILMLSGFLIYLNMSMNTMLLAWGKEKYVMYAVGIAGLVNILFNYLLIPEFGALGSAYTNIISELCYFIGLSILFYKANKSTPLKQTIKPVLIAFAFSFGAYMLYTYLGYPLLFMALAFILYSLVILAFGIVKIDELKRIIKK